jgi:hypothetical protein
MFQDTKNIRKFPAQYELLDFTNTLALFSSLVSSDPPLNLELLKIGDGEPWSKIFCKLNLRSLKSFQIMDGLQAILIQRMICT